jgi:ABC-type transport system involved in multi-copper enzyme maturation permease subunit
MRILTLVRRSSGDSWHVLGGCLVLLTAFQLVLAAQAASIETSQAFGRMTEFIPRFLQRGLGQQALLLASFRGTIAFGYFHPIIVVLVSVLAVYLATEPAYDVESGRVDLLLARAVPRHRLITRSLLLSAGAVVCAMALMALGTWAGLHVFASAHAASWPPARTIAVLIMHLTAVAWCFSALGLAAAAGSGRWVTAFTSVALLLMVTYLLDYLAIGWPRARAIAWLSPFDYYPAIPILAGTAPVWTNLLVLWIATIVFSAIAYWRFQRRDL